MFNWINWVKSWLFKKSKKTESTINDDFDILPIQESQRYHFGSILEKKITPDNASIQENEFIAVIYKNKPVWALFKCPCGCGYVITLPLQKPHNPKWRLYKLESKRPTLYPSVWQNKGCHSHFWIEDGKVIWCKDTGTELF